VLFCLDQANQTFSRDEVRSKSKITLLPHSQTWWTSVQTSIKDVLILNYICLKSPWVMLN